MKTARRTAFLSMAVTAATAAPAQTPPVVPAGFGVAVIATGLPSTIVDIAIDAMGGAFGGDLYTGSGAGSAGDCISRVGPAGGQVTLFHNVGNGPFSGSPNGLAFGSGADGFTGDLYFSVNHSGMGCR